MVCVQFYEWCLFNVHAFIPSFFGLVGAVEELALKQLDSDDGEDEVKECIDDQNVGHVL